MNRIPEILAAGGNFQIVVSAADLRSAFMEWAAAIRKQTVEDLAEPEAPLTETEVRSRLGISHTTLWRWQRKGYLHSVKVGNNLRWREKDIETLIKKEIR